MKKATCWLLAYCLCFCVGTAFSQVPALKPLVSKGGNVILRGGGNPAIFNVGNMRVKVSSPLVKAHGADLWAGHFSFVLPPSYVKYAPKNDARILKSTQKFIEDLKDFHRNAPAIAPLIESRVVNGKVPYAKWLPKDAKTIYIGELHNIPVIQKEAEALVRALPQIYPGRRIYLATEFLPAYENIDFSEDNFLLDKKEIMDIVGEPSNSTRVLFAAAEARIPVLGLEHVVALQQAIINDAGVYPSTEDYEQFGTSFEGVRMRNMAWAGLLRKLRAMDPEGLIVVYAGQDHVAYHHDSNLPSMMGGPSFVIQLAVPEALRGNNPLFRYLREDAAVRNQFRASPDAKLINWWTKNTRFKKLLGCDLSIVLRPGPTSK